MADPSERSLGQVINTWVQTAGILVAAAWGAYTFVYKEIVVPKSAPVNISVNLQLKKIGPGSVQTTSTKSELVAIEMRVSATNPSTREVYLLPRVWMAWGYAQSASDSALPVKDAEAALNSHQGLFIQKYSRSEATVVAVGSLFSDTVLKPNETTMRTHIIYVPAGMFDALEVATVMPTMAKRDGIAVEWRLNETGQSLDTVLYRVSANNERTEIKKDPDGSYSSLEKNGFQSARSVSEVSLWQ